jgi:hypothetical protein
MERRLASQKKTTLCSCVTCFLHVQPARSSAPSHVTSRHVTPPPSSSNAAACMFSLSCAVPSFHAFSAEGDDGLATKYDCVYGYMFVSRLLEACFDSVLTTSPPSMHSRTIELSIEGMVYGTPWSAISILRSHSLRFLFILFLFSLLDLLISRSALPSMSTLICPAMDR